MPNIADRLGISFSKYFLLNIITFGYYYIYLQFKLTRVMSEFGQRYTANGLLGKSLKFMVWFWIVSTILCITGLVLSINAIAYVGLFFYVLGGFAQLFWAFFARSGILVFCMDQHDIHYTANPVLLVFCPGLTLTWAIDSITVLAARKCSV